MRSGKSFAGRVAVVTGGASGLGRGLCETLARSGARVVIADLDHAGAQALAERISQSGARADALRVDVTDPQSVDDLVARTLELHGRIDLMFNNAGIVVAGELSDLTASALRRVIDVNLLGATYGTLAAYRVMRAQGAGHIVNIASMYGLFPAPLSVAYAAAKHGLVGLTQSALTESVGTGVDFTVVCPGFIATNLFAAGTYAQGMSGEQVAERVPFEMLDVQAAVDRTLAAVRARRRIVVFPAYAKAAWLLQRFWPSLLTWILRRVVADQRRRFAAPSDNASRG